MEFEINGMLPYEVGVSDIKIEDLLNCFVRANLGINTSLSQKTIEYSIEGWGYDPESHIAKVPLGLDINSDLVKVVGYTLRRKNVGERLEIELIDELVPRAAAFGTVNENHPVFKLSFRGFERMARSNDFSAHEILRKAYGVLEEFYEKRSLLLK
ncbi:MAG: hypothetical protein AABX83_00125 [Nanoarchaeota archaeon]